MKKDYILPIVAIAATAWAFSIPDAQSFREPAAARILCFHLPCAFLATGFVIAAGVFGFLYLRKRDSYWSSRLTAAYELGAILAGLTLATGIVFSRAQWNAWWQNDPRQTSFLVVCLMLIAGIVLRSAFGDPEKRRSGGAVYALAIQVPFLFLTFVYPRLPSVKKVTFHPNDTIVSNGIDYWYWSGLLGVGLAIVYCTFRLFSQRVQLELAEDQA